MSHHVKPFYGEEVLRDRQQEYIEAILKKYRNTPADENLKKKVWDELQAEKAAGRVTIPFKVVLEQDPQGLFAPCVKVLLDTKV